MNKRVISIIILSILMILSIIVKNNCFNSFIMENYTDAEKIEVFKKYKNQKINVCYGNKIHCNKINYKVQGTVNTDKLGVYTLTYSAKYKDKKIIKYKKVHVIDTIKPELNIEGNFDSVCPNGKAINVTYSAKDNYDGDITNKIKYNLEGNKIIYTVTDSSGNITKNEFDATIKDTDAPTILLTGGNNIYLLEGTNYKEPGYTAIDSCDGDLTSEVNITGSVGTAQGDYTLNYSVTDSNGNTANLTRTIKIYTRNNYQVGITTGKIIYLTFDDGPGPYTEKLLNILATYNVKATFFVIGTRPNYDYLITREHNEGHTVGLHAYTHEYSSIYSSDEAYYSDLNAISDKVRNLTGVNPTIIRFPGGSSNTVSKKYSVGIMSRIASGVEQRGYKYFDWTISSGDAGGSTNSDSIYWNVVNGVKENNTNVILMHDIKLYTVNAIERIIQYGLANGYTFAPLTINSPIVHQRINN